MGLKKLFSKDRDKSSSSLRYDQKNNAARSSISLSQSISKWTHKEKDKAMHSLSSNKELKQPTDSTRSNSANVDSIPIRPSTDSYSTKYSCAPENTNPFIATTPPSSTPSVNDVNNVVRVLRKTDYELLNGNTKTKEYEDSFEDGNSNLPTPPDASNSSNEQHEPKNPFLTQNAPIWDVDDSAASKLYDSKKYEFPDIKEESEQAEEANAVPVTNSNTDQAVAKKEDDGTLYSELLSVQKQLEHAAPMNDTNAKREIQNINLKLNSALEKSAHLESRLTSVIEASKYTILQKTDEIKQLEEQSRVEKSTISSMTKELEDLKAEVNALHDDNKEIDHLLKNSQLESNVNEDSLSQRLETLITMSSTSAILNTELKSQLDASSAKAQNSQHEIETLRLKLAELEKYREDGNTVRDLQTRLKELEEKITDMQTQLQTNYDVITALNQEKEDIQSQFENSKQISEQKLVDLQKAKDDTAELREVEKNELLKQVNDLANKNALLEPLCSESDKLREQIQSLEAQISQELTHKEEREKKYSGILDENNTQIESLEKERVSLLGELEQQKTSLDSNTAHVSSLEHDLTLVKEQIEMKEREKNALEEEMKTKQESLVYENTRLLSQVQILKGSTSDEVQQVAENNRMLNENLEKAQNSIQVLQSDNDQLRKQLETISDDAQHAVALTAQVTILNKSLEAAKEDAKQLEDLKDQLSIAEMEISSLKSSKDSTEHELRELLQENKEKSELSLKEANIESDKLTSELKLFQTKSMEAEFEINRLKEELVCMEEISKKSAQAVIDENERLEDQVQQIEENVHVVSSENETLKEEIELLSKNTTRRTLVNENQKMKNQLVTVSHLQQENASLQELVECLQEKIRELTSEDPIQQGVHVASPSFKRGYGDNNRAGTNQQQEELMLMHTRAQLGLIEYLEGESNIPQAMARFKKQLETEMKEFTNTPAGKSILFDSSTDVSDSDQQPTQNEPIPSISSSGRMR